MAAGARVAYLARTARDFGVATGPVSVDMGAVRSRKRDLYESWRSGSERRLIETPNLGLIMGEGRSVSPRVVTVWTAEEGKRVLEAPSSSTLERDRLHPRCLDSRIYPTSTPPASWKSMPFLSI